jgi:hypothetical protein
MPTTSGLYRFQLAGIAVHLQLLFNYIQHLNPSTSQPLNISTNETAGIPDRLKTSGVSRGKVIERKARKRLAGGFSRMMEEA